MVQRDHGTPADNRKGKDMSKIVRGFEAQTERYAFDFDRCTYANGWAQVDTYQDASYFGIWTNPDLREIVTYCEGDVTREICDDDGDYRAALVACLTFYKGPWRAWRAGEVQTRHATAMVDCFTVPAMRDRFVSLGLASYLH